MWRWLICAVVAVMIPGHAAEKPERRPRIVYYYAVWCGPCRLSEPELTELKKDPDWTIGPGRHQRLQKVDVDVEGFPPEVTLIPAWHVIDANGRIVKRHSGFANREQIKRWWNEVAGKSNRHRLIEPD